MQIIGNLRIDQIDEFIAFCQVVDDQNIGVAALVQATDQIASYEPCAARDHNHANSPAVTTDVPSFPTTMPPARFAHCIASAHGRPAARITARVARTVSPAPDPSNTSWACASV